MRKLTVAVLSLCLAFVWAQPALAQSDTPPPAEYEALITEWAAAFNAGDQAKMTSMYHSAAMRMPPRGDFIPADMLAEDLAGYAGWQIELGLYGGMIEGNMGTSWGWFELKGMDPNGNEIGGRGRWMNNYRMVDGEWKIYRDIWNFGPEGEPDWMDM